MEKISNIVFCSKVQLRFYRCRLFQISFTDSKEVQYLTANITNTVLPLENNIFRSGIQDLRYGLTENTDSTNENNKKTQNKKIQIKTTTIKSSLNKKTLGS